MDVIRRCQGLFVYAKTKETGTGTATEDRSKSGSITATEHSSATEHVSNTTKRITITATGRITAAGQYEPDTTTEQRGSTAKTERNADVETEGRNNTVT